MTTGETRGICKECHDTNGWHRSTWNEYLCRECHHKRIVNPAWQKDLHRAVQQPVVKAKIIGECKHTNTKKYFFHPRPHKWWDIKWCKNCGAVRDRYSQWLIPGVK